MGKRTLPHCAECEQKGSMMLSEDGIRWICDKCADVKYHEAITIDDIFKES